MLNNDFPQWVAFYTLPRNEKKIFSKLQEKGYITYLPLKKELHKWHDRKKWVDVPLIPSYIFVKAKKNIKGKIKNPVYKSYTGDWSGLRGSNSLPPPWQGGALPDELNPLIYWWLRSESNQRHEDFQSSALPTELQSLIGDPDGARTHDL